MFDITVPGADFGEQRLRLETLVRIRWLAVVGQTAAVLFVALVLDFPLPLGLCFAAIALSAWLNIFLKMRFTATHRLQSRWAAAMLAYDVLQLAALLYLTGGLENPFAVLLLAPVLVSATILTPQRTILLAFLMVSVATVLSFWHEPLPWDPETPMKLPFLYVIGVWVALLSGLAFMSVYAWRVAEEARQLADALAATELVLTREQHLSALDGLAAAAAHELGTPLATISLVSRELERDLPSGSPMAEDIGLLRTQSERCRDILRKITSLGGEGDEAFARLRFSHLIEEVVEPHRDFGIKISVEVAGDPAREPIVNRNPGVLYGLGNLVENAVDFAVSRVQIVVDWNGDNVVVTIDDDGPGFSTEVIDRIGDPYVTTRGIGAAGSDRKLEAGGLGLGFFIAKTLLERSGAQIDLVNRPSSGHGAVVKIRWPRAGVESWRLPGLTLQLPS